MVFSALPPSRFQSSQPVLLPQGIVTMREDDHIQEPATPDNGGCPKSTHIPQSRQTKIAWLNDDGMVVLPITDPTGETVTVTLTPENAAKVAEALLEAALVSQEPDFLVPPPALIVPKKRRPW